MAHQLHAACVERRMLLRRNRHGLRAYWTELRLRSRVPLAVQPLVLQLGRAFLAEFLVLLAVGLLAVHAAVLDEEAGRAVLELHAVATLPAAVGAHISRHRGDAARCHGDKPLMGDGSAVTHVLLPRPCGVSRPLSVRVSPRPTGHSPVLRFCHNFYPATRGPPPESKCPTKHHQLQPGLSGQAQRRPGEPDRSEAGSRATTHEHTVIKARGSARHGCFGHHCHNCAVATLGTATMATSCVPVATAADVCANCGREGGGGVKLKNCNACLLVKYCGVDCQKAHRKQHKKACKKRAAELKDERLYSQGHERPEGDFCPICTLPIPFPTDQHSLYESCCMKLICNGCALASQKRGIRGCPFCRAPMSDNSAENLLIMEARVEKNDPSAINFLAQQYCHGKLGLQKDMRRAVELWAEAAELGSIAALYSLGVSYCSGERGVEKDEAKGCQFYEKAAMQGHVSSRYNLGIIEGEKGNHDRASKHFLIAAENGHKDSLEMIRKLFIAGIASKRAVCRGTERLPRCRGGNEEPREG
ncbi:hypothetical protein THAOC_07107 [Thalassiosira oceanica]|uniref:MYND-type domain-containing protein n=1 Tax=Thalassiosira oceanica TaxID=159749 RepID=K0TD80_THAOC|nr:hypothetical protein THAOC_07107 [Thalassiosira oceanica]|eukprot:EJK71451.1 hypothetical protein THAOC_07107 [Thalassiosira oceanica]